MGSQHFQFRALPFGFCIAPRVFTKVFVNLVACLRSQGMHLHTYLEYLLLWSPSREQVLRDLQVTMQCLTEHSFLINLNKSSLTPIQRIEHVGMLIDTSCNSLFLPQDKIQKTRQLACQVIQAQYSSLSLLTKLMGILISSIDALEWGRLHSCPLQMLLRPFLSQILQKQDVPVYVLAHVKASLRCWTQPSNLQLGKKFGMMQEGQLFTDASLAGWGATLHNIPVQGQWTQQEARLPINVLELRAIWLALLQFRGHIVHHSVLVRTDNISAKAYFNNQGSSRLSAPQKEAMKLLQWAESHLFFFFLAESHLISVRAEPSKGQSTVKRIGSAENKCYQANGHPAGTCFYCFSFAWVQPGWICSLPPTTINFHAFSPVTGSTGQRE